MNNKIESKLKSIRNALVVRLSRFYDDEYRNWYFNYAPKLLKFENKHQGESCFIIGNGPSLNKMDLTLLNNYYTFGLNKIYLLLDKINLDISYHVAVNPLVIQQSQDYLNKLNCPSFFCHIEHLINY